MTATTVHSFAHAAEQAQQWVNELCADLGWSERRAYRLLRSVLHTLRDWLRTDEMADLAAQLPTLVRGVYFEGWGPSDAPPAERSKADFIARVDADFADDPIYDTAVAIAAVFRLLDRHVSSGEIDQVRASMRKSLRKLWPEH
ncbi:MAG: DUF2267 domain-containing protein [Rhizobiaceae bacterium]|nr:MAG: DUF2267 domain-containing protein [Rhizobiaceae bacterium]CAG0948265.1 hypothetical protein RHIZO_00014 [Rhizobiaceae bacterium]